jgi:predicted transcriptional regulator
VARSREQMINDVLMLVDRNDGVNQNHILLKANLNFTVWKRLELQRKGLVDRRWDGCYVITERGRKYMGLYCEMSKLLEGV